MQVTAEQTDPCAVTLDISLDEQQVTRTFDSTYREFGRHVSVPGFRPGKAPRAILERYVDKARVRERALEKLIADSYFKAIEEQGITPFRQPDIEPTDLEDKKPYTFKAVIPLEPQVTLGAYTGLTVEKPIFPVNDAVIEDRITRLREDRARLDRVTDRGVEAGDVLIADSQTVLEGQEPEGEPRRQLIQTGNNIPGFDEAILGMTPGEERVFDLTYPDDYTEEDKRGKKAAFTVKVHSLSAKKMPALDDDFAQQIGGVETVDALRAAIRQRLEGEASQLSDQIAEQRLIEQILAASEIHFPAALVREEVQENLQGLAAELRQNRLTYPDYLQRIGKSPEAHQNELAEQAETQIRTLLALRDIARMENLQADESQIEAQFTQLMSEGRITEDQYEEYRGDQRRRLQVANALIQQKLHDFLFANNTLNEVEQALPAEGEEVDAANAENESAETAGDSTGGTAETTVETPAASDAAPAPTEAEAEDETAGD